MKGLVTRELNQYAVEDLKLDPPKAGELRVKMGATGVCHSDLSVINGTLPLPRPMLLGHEGAGVVEAVGSGVSRFKPGDRVRVKNVHPATHTRMPRYCRGKAGVVHLDHGVYVFPDTHALGLGAKPQHCYSVRFSAEELWGEKRNDAMHIDLWDDYLDAA